MNRTFSSFLLILVPTFFLAACGDGSGSSTGGTGGTTASGGGGTGGATGGTTASGGTGGATGGTTASGGTGGATGGTGGAAMGACTNAADGAVLSDPATDAQAKVGACGKDNLGAEPATLDCIKAIGFSDGCAACFDGTVQCAIMNCLNDCFADANSQPCKDCRKTNCDPAFEACSGLVVP